MLWREAGTDREEKTSEYRVIDDGWHLQAVLVDGGWIEVDTLEDLEYYRTLAENGDLTQFVTLSHE